MWKLNSILAIKWQTKMTNKKKAKSKCMEDKVYQAAFINPAEGNSVIDLYVEVNGGAWLRGAPEKKTYTLKPNYKDIQECSFTYSPGSSTHTISMSVQYNPSTPGGVDARDHLHF